MVLTDEQPPAAAEEANEEEEVREVAEDERDKDVNDMGLISTFPFSSPSFSCVLGVCLLVVCVASGVGLDVEVVVVVVVV